MQSPYPSTCAGYLFMSVLESAQTPSIYQVDLMVETGRSVGAETSTHARWDEEVPQQLTDKGKDNSRKKEYSRRKTETSTYARWDEEVPQLTDKGKDNSRKKKYNRREKDFQEKPPRSRAALVRRSFEARQPCNKAPARERRSIRESCCAGQSRQLANSVHCQLEPSLKSWLVQRQGFTCLQSLQ